MYGQKFAAYFFGAHGIADHNVYVLDEISCAWIRKVDATINLDVLKFKSVRQTL